MGRRTGTPKDLAMSDATQDQQRRMARLARARRRFDGSQSFLLDRITEDLLDRLALVQRNFDQGLALMGRTATLEDGMKSSGKVAQVTRLEEMVSVPDDTPHRVAKFADLGLEPASLDLVICPEMLHFAEDLPGALIQIRRALRPDGLLLASLPGPQTLGELRQALVMAESATSGSAAMRVDAFTDIRDAGALLQRAGFALPVVDSDSVTVRYDTAFALVDDLRSFGVAGHAGLGTVPPLSRAAALELTRCYGEAFSDPDGRIRATFQSIHLSGWAPHDSQQKPLKPGSASTRLADALGTDEIKLKK